MYLDTESKVIHGEQLALWVIVDVVTMIMRAIAGA